MSPELSTGAEAAGGVSRCARTGEAKGHEGTLTV